MGKLLVKTIFMIGALFAMAGVYADDQDLSDNDDSQNILTNQPAHEAGPLFSKDDSSEDDSVADSNDDIGNGGGDGGGEE